MMQATTPRKQTQEHELLRFSTNWNNKLNCEFFTAIRLKSNSYKPGDTLRVLLEQNGALRTICDASIIEVRPLRIFQLNDWMCMLDSGMNADRFKNELYNMYKDQVKDINDAEFVYLLLRKVKVSGTQTRMFNQIGRASCRARV